jgi:hypothetical protein
MGDLDRVALHAATHAAWRASGAVALAIISLFIGATVYQQNVNQRLDQSEMFACQRVQLQRERTNVVDARDYLLMAAIAEAPRASPKVRAEYSGLARTARYDPPTDCRAAVKHPGSYRRPAFVVFVGARARGERGVFPKRFARSLVRAAQEGRPQPRP